MFVIRFVTVQGPNRRCWSFWFLDKPCRWFSYKTFWPISRWCLDLNVLRYACDRAVCSRHLWNVAESIRLKSRSRSKSAWESCGLRRLSEIWYFKLFSLSEFEGRSLQTSEQQVYVCFGGDQFSMTLVFVVLFQRLSRKESSQLCSSQ